MKNQKQPPLWLCVHESAHAVSRLVLNDVLIGPPVEEVSVQADGDMLGVSRQALRNHRNIPIDSYPEKHRANAVCRAEYDIIDTLAGLAAELCYRNRARLVGIWMADHVIDGVLAVDPTKIICGDLHSVRRTLDWMAPADPRKTVHGLWLQAVDLVDAEYAGIVRMARILRDVGLLDGELFDELWRKHRTKRR